MGDGLNQPSSVTVSYTHLDVYKRQRYHFYVWYYLHLPHCGMLVLYRSCDNRSIKHCLYNVRIRMIDTAQAYHNEEGVGNTIRKSGMLVLYRSCDNRSIKHCLYNVRIRSEKLDRRHNLSGAFRQMCIRDRVIFVSYVSDGVENNGFEPLTLCVQGRCSSQLS